MFQRKQGHAPFARLIDPTATAVAVCEGAEDERRPSSIRLLVAAEMRAAITTGDLAGVMNALRLLDPRAFQN